MLNVIMEVILAFLTLPNVSMTHFIAVISIWGDIAIDMVLVLKSFSGC